jgi:hypothetical protein
LEAVVVPDFFVAVLLEAVDFFVVAVDFFVAVVDFLAVLLVAFFVVSAASE